MPRVGETDRRGDGGEFVLGLHEQATVFRQLAAQGLHDGRPWCDGITSAVADASREQSIAHGGVAVGGDTVLVERLAWVELVSRAEDRADFVGEAGVECEHHVAQDVLRLARELVLDDADQFIAVEVEDFR